MRSLLVSLFLLLQSCVAYAQVPVCRNVTEPTVKCNAVGDYASYEARLPSWFVPPGSSLKITGIRLWSELGAGADYSPGTNGQFGFGIDPGRRYAKTAKFPPWQLVNPTFTQGLGALRLAPYAATFYFAEFITPFRYTQDDGIAIALTCNGSAFDLQIYWTICADMAAFPATCGPDTSLMINGDSAGVVDSSDRAWVIQEQNNAFIGTVPVNTNSGVSAMFFDGNSNLKIVGNGAFGHDFHWNSPRTIQTWIYPTDVSIDASFRHIASGGAGGTAFAISILNNGKVAIGNELAVISQSGTACAINTWCHVAWVLDNVNSCLYLDGVSQGCVPDTTLYSTTAVYVGRYGGANQGRFKGYMKEFSVVMGALYTGNFTPPTGPRC